MLDFHRKIIYPIYKEATSNIADNYVSIFVILNVFGSRNKEDKYGKHSILEFLLFWVVTSANYYSSVKDKYMILYFSSYCLSRTLQYTDTKE